LKFGGSLVIT